MNLTTEICSAFEDHIEDLMIKNNWKDWSEFSKEDKLDIYCSIIEKFGSKPEFIDLFLIQTYLTEVLRGTYTDGKDALLEYLTDMLDDQFSFLVEKKCDSIEFQIIEKTQEQEDEENLADFNKTEAQSINAVFGLPCNSLNDL